MQSAELKVFFGLLDHLSNLRVGIEIINGIIDFVFQACNLNLLFAVFMIRLDNRTIGSFKTNLHDLTLLKALTTGVHRFKICL